MTLPACLTSLKVEKIGLMATLIHPRSGKMWRMPALEWLMEECEEFYRAGKLDVWLAYYGNFHGLRKK